MSYASVNPATGEVLESFPEHTDEEMWGALATADKAFRLGVTGFQRALEDYWTSLLRYFLKRRKNWLVSPHWKWVRESLRAEAKWN